MGNELARVRLVSRLAASGLAGFCALLLFLSAPAVRFHGDDGLGPAAIEAVNVQIGATERPRVIERERHPVEMAVPIRMVSAESGGVDLRLWRYGAAGEIVFDNAEHYQRCIDARRSGRDSSDCPSALDRTAMRYASAGERELRIDRARPRRRS